MHNEVKCQLAVCTCLAKAGDPYCSEYCRQASAQGAERDFCQCAHSTCVEPKQVELIDEAGLPGSISFAPGSVTILYSNERDLLDQLILIAARLEAELGTEPRPRLPASRVESSKRVASQSA